MVEKKIEVNMKIYTYKEAFEKIKANLKINNQCIKSNLDLISFSFNSSKKIDEKVIENVISDWLKQSEKKWPKYLIMSKKRNFITINDEEISLIKTNNLGFLSKIVKEHFDIIKENKIEL